MILSGVPDYPTNHQEVFEFAIKQSRSVIAEFGNRHDYWVLRHWAKGYARANGLQCPVNREKFGIYYEPDEEEIAELQKEGLL
jgi:hypothetical protein